MLTKSGRRSPPHPRCTRIERRRCSADTLRALATLLGMPASIRAARLIVVFNMCRLRKDSDILRCVETVDAWLGRTLASGRVGAAPDRSPDAILEVARGHRVDVLLADLLLRAPSTPEPFSRAALEAVVRLAVARELAAARDMSRLFEAASAAALDVLLLKGTALAYTHYPQPHLRPRNDIDLFVRHTDIGRAETVLSSLGFARGREA